MVRGIYDDTHQADCSSASARMHDLTAGGDMHRSCSPQEQLKSAVWHAPSTPGEVQRIISEAPFKPGVRGFTSLLQLCSKDRTPKAWQKVGLSLRMLVCRASHRQTRSIVAAVI
jgi:hypothetical protein